jgi:hypothetical protein
MIDGQKQTMPIRFDQLGQTIFHSPFHDNLLELMANGSWLIVVTNQTPYQMPCAIRHLLFAICHLLFAIRHPAHPAEGAGRCGAVPPPIPIRPRPMIPIVSDISASSIEVKIPNYWVIFLNNFAAR